MERPHPVSFLTWTGGHVLVFHLTDDELLSTVQSIYDALIPLPGKVLAKGLAIRLKKFYMELKEIHTKWSHFIHHTQIPPHIDTKLKLIEELESIIIKKTGDTWLEHTIKGKTAEILFYMSKSGVTDDTIKYACSMVEVTSVLAE